MKFEKNVKKGGSAAGYKIKDTLLNFIVPLISLGVTLLLAFTIAIPSRSKLPTLDTQLKAAGDLRAKLETKIGVLEQLVEYQVVVDEDVKIFEQALPEEAMVPELLTQVDTIARESGLKVTVLSYSVSEFRSTVTQEEEGATYETIIINLGVEGGYDQILAFLQNLEMAARIVNVQTIRLTGGESEEGAVYKTTFILSAPYLYVESEAVTDAEVTVDISNSGFLNTLESAKELKYYDINSGDQFINVEESPLEEVTDTGEEEEAPVEGEGEVPPAEGSEGTEEETPVEETP
jgi:Tfp pilus assembly protein PilO